MNPQSTNNLVSFYSRHKKISWLILGIFLSWAGFQAWKAVYNRNDFIKNAEMFNGENELCYQNNGHFLFGDIYGEVLKNLVENNWNESGDWQGDVMHDATSFAPYVLYKTGRACLNSEFVKKADKTVEHELSLIDKVIALRGAKSPRQAGGLFENLYKASFGAFGLFDGWENYSGSWLKKVKTKVYLRASIASADLILYLPFKTVERIQKTNWGLSLVGLETTALMAIEGNFKMYEITKNPLYAQQGLRILNKVLKEYWKDANYSEELHSGWSGALGFSALWKAYAITNHQKYQEIAEKTYQNLRKFLGRNSLQTVWCHSELSALSDSLFWVKALTDGYIFAGQEEYLLQTEDLISKIISTFYQDGYLRHDAGVKTSGGIFWPPPQSYCAVSSHYCAGCNFFALEVIYNFNKAQSQ